jgi:hypothetical protein
MPYFSKFPILQYPVRDGETLRYVFVANMLRRVALSSDLKNSDGAFVEYDIKDGERPEHIAERVYGDPSFHWLVLMTNDIIDPYHGWYKSEIAMEDYVQTKHGGYTVYITNTSDSFYYQSSIVTGSTLTQGGVVSSVIDYIPELCKLTVDAIGFSKGNATIGVSGGTVYTVKIQKVEPSYMAVHHFQIPFSSGISAANDVFTVDPLSQQTGSYSIVGGVIGSSENEYPNLTTVGVGYSGSGTVDFWETYIGKYMGVSGAAVTTYAVSNYTHENSTNEQKRTIKILHPRYKREALAELESLLRV